MDKKAKKKLQALQQRKQKLEQQIAGARKQNDEPEQLDRLENELSDVLVDIEKIKAE